MLDTVVKSFFHAGFFPAVRRHASSFDCTVRSASSEKRVNCSSDARGGGVTTAAALERSASLRLMLSVPRLRGSSVARPRPPSRNRGTEQPRNRLTIRRLSLAEERVETLLRLAEGEETGELGAFEAVAAARAEQSGGAVGGHQPPV